MNATMLMDFCKMSPQATVFVSVGGALFGCDIQTNEYSALVLTIGNPVEKAAAPDPSMTLDQLRTDTVGGLKQLLGNPLAQFKMTAGQKREAQAAVQYFGSGQGDTALSAILTIAQSIDKDTRDDVA